jgi:hypothetical protein
MVTFATGSVWEMATNWVRNAQRAGVAEVLIGALDQQMIDRCDTHGVPCVLVDGGSVTAALANRSAANVREDATLYPKMSVLKVGYPYPCPYPKMSVLKVGYPYPCPCPYPYPKISVLKVGYPCPCP